MRIVDIFLESSQRVKTALVLLIIVISVALINYYTLTWIFFGVIFYIGFDEACKIFGIENKNLHVCAILLWIGAYFVLRPYEIVFVMLVILASVLAHKQELDKKIFLPFLYPTLPIFILFGFYKDFGMSYLVWLSFIVALSDTGAYYFGKTFGKTSFSQTSPNKTWEGTFGGIFSGTLIGIIFGMFMNYGFLFSLFISCCVSIASVWGDLFESYLKRKANIKDSGSIFPDHGGMLDRIDGYLFGVIVMSFILNMSRF